MSNLRVVNCPYCKKRVYGPHGRPIQIDRKVIIRIKTLYVKKKMTMLKVALDLKISESSVRRVLKEAGLSAKKLKRGRDDNDFKIEYDRTIDAGYTDSVRLPTGALCVKETDASFTQGSSQLLDRPDAGP